MSQFECSVAMIAPLLLTSAVTGNNPPRLGNRSLRFAPQGVYPCAGVDAWCALSVRTDEQWRALAKIIDREGWAKDRRFATVADRQRGHDEIDARLNEWTKQFSNRQVEAKLKASGVPAERVRRINDLIGKPDGATVYRSMTDPRAGTMLTTGLPFCLSSGALPPPTPAPALGAHSEEVLRQWLNLGAPDIQSLKNLGALS